MKMQLSTSRPLPRVLIADDDPVMRQILKAMITKEGYEAVVVEDGREAFRILQSDSNFRGGIFDMMMPHLQGIDIISYMRTENRLRRIPVLMISAESDLKLMAKSFVAGATVFLTKPFTPEQFQTTFRILMANQPTPIGASQDSYAI